MKPEGQSQLFTVGHGTLTADELGQLLKTAQIERVVDVRTAPGSRRSPQFSRSELEAWMPEAGLHYAWEPDLGGFRRPSANSPNMALRNASFRGYADYMATATFINALAGVVKAAQREAVVTMCAETLWWRCHRRLIADAATLLHGMNVCHLGHDRRMSAHRLTEGVRLADDHLVYDGGQERLMPKP